MIVEIRTSEGTFTYIPFLMEKEASMHMIKWLMQLPKKFLDAFSLIPIIYRGLNFAHFLNSNGCLLGRYSFSSTNEIILSLPDCPPSSNRPSFSIFRNLKVIRGKIIFLRQQLYHYSRPYMRDNSEGIGKPYDPSMITMK